MTNEPVIEAADADLERTLYLDKTNELQKAWKELDDERAKITKLDIEIAKLKDDKAKLEQIKDNLFQTFQDLYNQYQQLYDQVVNSNTALTITTGKLAESLVKCKFTIPQAEQSRT